MSGGVLNFSILKPDWLNFGRTAAFEHELTIESVLSPPSGSFQFFIRARLAQSSGARLHTAHSFQIDRAVPHPSTLPVTRGCSVAAHTGQPTRQTRRAAWYSGQSIQTRLGFPFAAAQPQQQPTAMAWESGRFALV